MDLDARTKVNQSQLCNSVYFRNVALDFDLKWQIRHSTFLRPIHTVSLYAFYNGVSITLLSVHLLYPESIAFSTLLLLATCNKLQYYDMVSSHLSGPPSLLVSDTLLP